MAQGRNRSYSTIGVKAEGTKHLAKEVLAWRKKKLIGSLPTAKSRPTWIQLPNKKVRLSICFRVESLLESPLTTILSFSHITTQGTPMLEMVFHLSFTSMFNSPRKEYHNYSDRIRFRISEALAKVKYSSQNSDS